MTLVPCTCLVRIFGNVGGLPFGTTLHDHKHTGTLTLKQPPADFCQRSGSLSGVRPCSKWVPHPNTPESHLIPRRTLQEAVGAKFSAMCFSSPMPAQARRRQHRSCECDGNAMCNTTSVDLQAQLNRTSYYDTWTHRERQRGSFTLGFQVPR